LEQFQFVLPDYIHTGLMVDESVSGSGSEWVRGVSPSGKMENSLCRHSGIGAVA